MSELTRCNWCNLQDIKEGAKERGATVKLFAAAIGVGPFWVAAQASDRSEPDAWFLEVPLECAC